MPMSGCLHVHGILTGVDAVVLMAGVRSSSCTCRPLGVAAGERAGVRGFAAGGAVHPRLEDRAATVFVDGWEHLTGHVPVTPLLEHHDHWQQVAAGPSQPVLVARRPAGVLR